MKLLRFAFLLPLFSGCLNSDNSFTGDKVLTSQLGIGASALQQGQCLSCHQHTHWADYKTNADFLAELQADGDLIPGNAEASGLFLRITGASGYSIMPPPSQRSALTDQEVELFRQWINGMAPTTPATSTDAAAADTQ